MKKVLVLVDFSEGSINALNYAVHLFDRVKTEFTVLNAQPTYDANYEPDDYVEDFTSNILSEDQEDTLDQLVMRYDLRRNSNHTFSSVVLKDTLITSIKTILSTKDHDCIVMGVSHKRDVDLQDFSWSHTTVKLIKHFNEQTFIIVPENYGFRNLKRVLFSTNYKRSFRKSELKLLLDLVQIYGSKFTISQLMLEEYMTDKQHVHKESLKSIIADIPHDFTKINLELSEFIAIHDYAFKEKINMIALINHKLNFFTRVLEEHVAQKASIYSTIPVLILPETIE